MSKSKASRTRFKSTPPKILKEFEKIKLGDARLERRCLKIIDKLNDNPNAETINATIQDWESTKAAYNFFANEKCHSDKLLAPHIKQTVNRLKNHDYFLAISDTTTANYHNLKQTVGLGSIGRYSRDNQHSQGIFIHVTYAVSLSGLPIGILAWETWVRPPEGYGKRRNKDNESDRWLRQFKQAAKLCPKETKMIYVADRESDLYEIYEEADKIGVDVVVRSSHDRRVKGDGRHIRMAQDESDSVGNVSLEVDRKSKGKRMAELEVKFLDIQIEHPDNAKTTPRNRRYIDLTLVSSEEINCPVGEKKLYWRLLTTNRIDNLRDCIEIIEIYKKRWLVELEVLQKVVDDSASSVVF